MPFHIGSPWTRNLAHLLARGVLVCVFSLNVGLSLALILPESEAHKDIDRLYELAIKGENREAALEGIQTYVERGDIKIGDQQYALRRLQQLAAPELKDYLLRVAMGEVEFENSARLRSHAHRAYWATLLAEAKDENNEERVLVEGLEAHVKGAPDGYVRAWAADELCRRGKSKHFEKIARSVTSYISGSRAQQRIDLCRRKIELINMFDSRPAAMKHILESIDPTVEEKLVDWALDELIKLQPSNMDQILIDYILRLQNDPEIKPGDFVFYRPFLILRKRDWTDEKFKVRGIKPEHWI